MISEKMKEKISLMLAFYFPFTHEEIKEELNNYNSVDVVLEGMEKSMEKELGELSLKHACKEANNVLNKNTK